MECTVRLFDTVECTVRLFDTVESTVWLFDTVECTVRFSVGHCGVYSKVQCWTLWSGVQ